MITDICCDSVTTLLCLQRTQSKCTECKCHRGTDPQAKTQCHEFFRPFAPSHHWSLCNSNAYDLSKNPPQCGTKCHREHQSTSAAHCWHSQNGHHWQCHHHQDKRYCSAHNSRKQPTQNYASEPQAYGNDNSHQTANASYMTASGKNAAGQ